MFTELIFLSKLYFFAQENFAKQEIYVLRAALLWNVCGAFGGFWAAPGRMLHR